MRKIVFKTIFITPGIVLILANSEFGILSFAAPKAMMNFSASLGLDAISCDYAYQEYRRSGDINYLAYAFEVAAVEGRPAAAAERFEEFYENEGFASYCTEQDGQELGEDIPKLNYRSYACGLGACALFAVAETDEETLAVYTFALRETSEDFEPSNLVVSIERDEREADEPACGGNLVDIIEDEDI